MIRGLDEKCDDLAADVIASMDTMSSYTVYALGSSEWVVLLRLEEASRYESICLNATADSAFRTNLQQHGTTLVSHGNSRGSRILMQLRPPHLL